MTTDTLLSYALSRQHEVIYTSTSGAFSVEEANQCYIAMPCGLSSIDEKQALAHELGHCEYGGFYNRYSKYDIRAKAERRADKWAFAKLVPYGQLMQALRHGVTEMWELAEYFDVSCDFINRAVEYYKTAII